MARGWSPAGVKAETRSKDIVGKANRAIARYATPSPGAPPRSRPSPDDGVARHRLAALGVAHHQPVDPLDLDATAEPQALDDAAERGGPRGLQVVRGQLGKERPHHLAQRQIAPAQSRFQLLRAADGQ